MPYWGLLRTKEALILTLRGWVVALVLMFGLALFVVLNLKLFFAISDPVPSNILVVEGWVPDYALVSAAQEFRQNGYKLLVTTGEPLQKGGYLQEFDNYAELARATLLQLGVGSDSVVTVVGPRTRVDRTYTSALAFRSWLVDSLPNVHAVNIMTLGVHARRTRLLFQRALGEDVNVGIISIEDQEFDPRLWWTTSSGFQRVLEEVVGYIYAML